MKKISSLLVIVLSLVLATCIVFTGCNKNKGENSSSSSTQGRLSVGGDDESSSSSSVEDSSSSSSTGAPQGPSSSSVEPGASSSSSSSSSTSTQPGSSDSSQGGGGGGSATVVAFFDFSTLGLAKGDAVNGLYNNNFYNIIAGVYTTSTAGIAALDGSQQGHSFTGAVQLGKKGSFSNKSIQFTVTGACTIEVYATRGSSTVASGNLSLVNQAGQTVATLQPTADLNVQVFQITTAGTYALCALDDVSSINVWGIAVEGEDVGGGDDVEDSSSERDPDTPNYDN